MTAGLPLGESDAHVPSTEPIMWPKFASESTMARGYRGVCSCGWVGEEHSMGLDARLVKQRDRARQDALDHARAYNQASERR